MGSSLTIAVITGISTIVGAVIVVCAEQYLEYKKKKENKKNNAIVILMYLYDFVLGCNKYLHEYCLCDDKFTTDKISEKDFLNIPNKELFRS